jgi:hypothetical protein
MKPISRFRIRARCVAFSFATGSPVAEHVLPPVGVSSRPRIESSVVLPQPDGPLIATYSPCRISRWMFGQRVRLDLVRVEDLLDPRHADEGLRGRQVVRHGHRSILTRLTLSKRDMSEMMTLSRVCSPCRTSIVLTDARPSLTLMRVADFPSGSMRKSPIACSGCP